MSTETTDVKFSMQAFKEASLAFVGMDWVGKSSQDEQTNAAAQEAFAKISQVAKEALAEAKNPICVPEAQDSEALAAPVATDDYVALVDEEPALLVGSHGATTVASSNGLEDDIAVCWDMAEQLEDDLEGVSGEVATEFRNAINLLKAAKTPTDIEHAKRIAKAARAAAENSGSEVGDDEPTLNDKLSMLNMMYEAAKKSNEAALEYIRTMDDIRKENPGLFSKEGWDAHDAWAEKASKRQEEAEARRKAQEKEERAAKTDEERHAIADKYLRLQAEAAERAKKEDEEYQEQLDKEAKRIAKSGSEKDKQDLQKAQDEFRKYKAASQSRDDLSEKAKAEYASYLTGFATDKAIQSNQPNQHATHGVESILNGDHFLATQAKSLEFSSADQGVKKPETSLMQTKTNPTKSADMGDDLLSELGAPTEKDARDVAVAKNKANTTKIGDVSEDVLGELAAPLGGKAIKDMKAQTRIG